MNNLSEQAIRKKLNDRIAAIDAELKAVKRDVNEHAVDEADAEMMEAVADVVAALEPFAELAEDRSADAPEWGDHETVSVPVSIQELRAAKDAFARINALTKDRGDE